MADLYKVQLPRPGSASNKAYVNNRQGTCMYVPVTRALIAVARLLSDRGWISDPYVFNIRGRIKNGEFVAVLDENAAADQREAV